MQINQIVTKDIRQAVPSALVSGSVYDMFLMLSVIFCACHSRRRKTIGKSASRIDASEVKKLVLLCAMPRPQSISVMFIVHVHVHFPRKPFLTTSSERVDSDDSWLIMHCGFFREERIRLAVGHNSFDTYSGNPGHLPSVDDSTRARSCIADVNSWNPRTLL
ncbi:hypothetical protein F5878DRAFT_606156 [Lentinula raphanica]|uniref:Uncharacterized protein n=1 Tax=Lentinula raphanica TaxID=153919 RepID=A0AA38PI08_9AGAR|nr:hypothetical protein F5878DRAFT_606156 [Lentinula raphanica]